MDIAGSAEWVAPLTPPSFLFPKLNHLWEAESYGPASYASSRRELAIVCVGWGDPMGGLRDPLTYNFLPKEENQMNFTPGAMGFFEPSSENIFERRGPRAYWVANS